MKHVFLCATFTDCGDLQLGIGMRNKFLKRPKLAWGGSVFNRAALADIGEKLKRITRLYV